MRTNEPELDNSPDTQVVRMGQELRVRRKTLGISMVAAAEAAGMSRVTWHRLEKGEPSVAWGSMMAAGAVLGFQLQWARETDADDGQPQTPSLDAWLPLHISLADFPGLRTLAWQVHEGLETLSPREAFGLYDRNWRHLDEASLGVEERALVRALNETFG